MVYESRFCLYEPDSPHIKSPLLGDECDGRVGLCHYDEACTSWGGVEVGRMGGEEEGGVGGGEHNRLFVGHVQGPMLFRPLCVTCMTHEGY